MNTFLIEYRDDGCTVSISGQCILVDLSFAIESITSYLFGRGIYRFECTRTKKENGSCVLSFNSLVKAQDTQFSKVATIGSMVESGYFPRSIKPSDRFKNDLREERPVHDGQHTHSVIKKNPNTTSTLIEQKVIEAQYSLSTLTYGLADMFTGLFSLGVTYLKWQGSLDMIQLYFKHSLTEQEIKTFLRSKVDYDISMTVDRLEE